MVGDWHSGPAPAWLKSPAHSAMWYSRFAETSREVYCMEPVGRLVSQIKPTTLLRGRISAMPTPGRASPQPPGASMEGTLQPLPPHAREAPPLRENQFLGVGIAVRYLCSRRLVFTVCREQKHTCIIVLPLIYSYTFFACMQEIT